MEQICFPFLFFFSSVQRNLDNISMWKVIKSIDFHSLPPGSHWIWIMNLELFIFAIYMELFSWEYYKNRIIFIKTIQNYWFEAILFRINKITYFLIDFFQSIYWFCCFSQSICWFCDVLPMIVMMRKQLRCRSIYKWWTWGDVSIKLFHNYLNKNWIFVLIFGQT